MDTILRTNLIHLLIIIDVDYWYFFFRYETSDGTSHQETGELKNAGSENEAISVRGQFSYTGADGVVYSVTYIADENGFQPQGAHIPQAH